MLRDSVHIALFAAITAALGLIPKIDLGIGVPITAQLLGVMLAGSVLGARRGFLAMALFLTLVAAGLPLLAGGRGGLGVLVGPSAGFLLAWPVAAALIGLATERLWTRLTYAKAFAINALLGILPVYALGIPVLAAVSGIPVQAAFLGSLAFIPGDLVKAAIAAWVTLFVKRGYPLIGRETMRE